MQAIRIDVIKMVYRRCHYKKCGSKPNLFWHTCLRYFQVSRPSYYTNIRCQFGYFKRNAIENEYTTFNIRISMPIQYNNFFNE